MLAILGLVSIGLLMSALIDSSSDGGDSTPTPDSFSDDDDAVLDNVYRPDVESNLLDLVNEGEITQAVADDALARINFTNGAQNVSTLGGDDVIALGAGDDIINTGDGDDSVLGGAGDDEVDMGLGSDSYGVDTRAIPTEEDDILGFPEPDLSFGASPEQAESFLEGGDDRIFGGAGNDAISDSYGSNFIQGQQGDDFIVTVDADGDEGTADRVKGGFGKDTIIVDEGDSVETGRGFDTVTVDVFAGVEAGYDVVTIDDFERGKDTLEIEGDVGLLRPTPENPGDEIVDPITVAPMEDGSGSIVSINGIPVIHVIGPANLTAADIIIST